MRSVHAAVVLEWWRTKPDRSAQRLLELVEHTAHHNARDPETLMAEVRDEARPSDNLPAPAGADSRAGLCRWCDRIANRHVESAVNPDACDRHRMEQGAELCDAGPSFHVPDCIEAREPGKRFCAGHLRALDRRES